MADNNSGAAIGFIGLGTMGMPMALNLLQGGHWLGIWGRNPEKMKDAIDAGAVLAASPKALAAECDILFLCVTDTNAVEQLTFGADGIAEGAGADLLLVDHSSINPDATRDFAGRLKDSCGAAWVDAPVSGGKHGAAGGTLVIMAGGAAADIERMRTVCEATSQRVTHMGPVGTGQATKIVNQAIIGAEIAVLAETLGFAKTYGVDCQKVPEALAGGWADSTVLQDHGKRMINAEYWESAPGNMIKDMNVACDMAKATTSPMPVTALVTELYRMLGANGDANKGQIGLMYLYKQDAL